MTTGRVNNPAFNGRPMRTRTTINGPRASTRLMSPVSVVATTSALFGTRTRRHMSTPIDTSRVTVMVVCEMKFHSSSPEMTKNG